MPAMANTAACAVIAWLCLCQIHVAVSWSCSLTMTGDHGMPQNLSLAQTALHCTPDAGESGALPVYFSDKLLNRSLQGHHSDLSFSPEDVAATEEQPPCTCIVLVASSSPAQRQCIIKLTLACTAAGVQAHALPDGLNYSLLYFQQANLSFQGAQVLDIHAGSFENIIAFNSCTHLNPYKPHEQRLSSSEPDPESQQFK